MARKKKTIHYLYKTTCIVTNKFYIGMHSTCILEDGYLGSGKRLRYSLRKHGKENHVKEILEFFDSREQLIAKEKEIVNTDLINDKQCLNLQPGGGGGFLNEEHKLKCWAAARIGFAKKLAEDPEYRERNKQQLQKNRLKAIENKNNLGKRPLGIRHTEESKKKIGSANKKYTANLNSQWGTCWITKESENKKIQKINIDSWIQQGWKKGRYIKKKKE
jgi:hypothetical protein